MGYWLKSYTDILDDPKYHRMPERAQLAMHEIFLVAKMVETDELTGLLPCIEDIAFYSRKPIEYWNDAIPELLKSEIIEKNRDGFLIVNYIKRQQAIPVDERMKQYRKRKNDQAMEPNDRETDEQQESYEDVTLCNGERENTDREQIQIENREDRNISAKPAQPEPIRDRLISSTAEPVQQPNQSNHCTTDGSTTEPMMVQPPDLNHPINHQVNVSTKNKSEPIYSDFDDDLDIPEKKPRKKKSVSDPRTAHPAIQTWRSVTGYFPPLINYDRVINALGNNPDKAKLFKVYEEWRAHNYSMKNIAGITDWYVNGVQTNGRKPPINTGMDAVKKELERLEEEDV